MHEVNGGETQTASHIVGRERRARVWTLTLATGPRCGAQCALKKGESLVLGRGGLAFGSPEHLADARLSRKHLELSVDPSGELIARDMGSRNGSFLNAERFERASLRTAEILGLGRTLILVEPGEVAPSAAGDPTPAASVSFSIALAAIRRGVANDGPLVLSGPPGTGRNELIDWVARGRPLTRWRPGEATPSVLDPGTWVAIEQIEFHPRPTTARLAQALDAGVRLVVTTGLPLEAFLSGSPVPHEIASRLGAGFVRVPALRDRRADIPAFAAQVVREHDEGAMLDPELVFRLLAYDWPGNLHQLQGVLEHCIAASEGHDVISLPADLDALLDVRPAHSAAPSPQALVVAKGGIRFTWGETTSQDWSASSPVARVLWALARRRASGSFEAIDPDMLVLEVWPDEKLVRRSGRNRLYVALSSLRKAGLADLLERNAVGYRLSPSVEVITEAG